LQGRTADAALERQQAQKLTQAQSTSGNNSPSHP
jgi:hypothetical protein